MMKSIQLTQNKQILIDDEDYELTSKFKWYPLKSSNTFYAICSVHLGYLHFPIKKRIKCTIRLHRLIMRPPKGMEVDHINQNGLDCRRSNLRLCTKSQNQYNSNSSVGRSQYKGVSWDNDQEMWRADIHHNGKHIFIGRFLNEIEAACAYDMKALEIAGTFACTNILPVVPVIQYGYMKGQNYDTNKM